MKKALLYSGWILFAFVLTAMFWITKPSDTVDFSGVVKSIEYNKQEKCSCIKASLIYDDASRVTVKVKDNISVKEVTSEKMKIDDIGVGDLIILDYKGKINGKSGIVTAKWIKVAKGYMLKKGEVK